MILRDTLTEKIDGRILDVLKNLTCISIENNIHFKSITKSKVLDTLETLYLARNERLEIGMKLLNQLRNLKGLSIYKIKVLNLENQTFPNLSQLKV